MGFIKQASFFTACYTPHTAGVNAMLQDWGKLHDATGGLLLWVFPPFHLVGQVIVKLVQEQLPAILLVPAWVCYWTPLLRGLSIRDEVSIPYNKGLYILGSRLPESMQRSGCPYPLTAYFVQPNA